MQSLYLNINNRRHFIREVDILTDARFDGRYKGYYCQVCLDIDDYSRCDDRYYINVYNPEAPFDTAYDGWAPKEIDNLIDAIKETIVGSNLDNK
jgi:hypothetical protein